LEKSKTAILLTLLNLCANFLLGMRTLTLELVGTSPLILHKVSRHQLRDQIASTKGATMTVAEEAQDNMLINDDGNPAVPASWIMEAVRVGCSRIFVDTPQGRQQFSFVKLAAVMKIADMLIPLRDKDGRNPTWIPYTSFQHAAPGSKKMIAVVAPQFNNWMLFVQLTISDPTLDNEILKRVFEEAGRSGIGLFHPPKKNFGRFEVSM
jgi:hypothetical protein